jgi:transcriptional regulator with XRE-family HTH domain
MTGNTLKTARKRAGWTQARLADVLGATQAYVSLMESAKRAVPDRFTHAVARALDLPATSLPVVRPTASTAKPTNEALADELANLGYPKFAYLKRGRARRNPAQLLLAALAHDDLEARVLEALPWLLLRFDELDVELVVHEAKLGNLQNRLGFVVALARDVAENNPTFGHRLAALRELERCLEDSRLAREDSLGRTPTTDRMRSWLRDHRTKTAKHWNLLTDLRSEHLPYATKPTPP